MGRVLSTEQEALLKKSGAQMLTLLLDGDRPGGKRPQGCCRGSPHTSSYAWCTCRMERSRTRYPRSSCSTFFASTTDQPAGPLSSFEKRRAPFLRGGGGSSSSPTDFRMIGSRQRGGEHGTLNSEREAKLQKLAELEGFDTVEAMFDAAVAAQLGVPGNLYQPGLRLHDARWHPINGRGSLRQLRNADGEKLSRPNERLI